jgi:hypothetical protein
VANETRAAQLAVARKGKQGRELIKEKRERREEKRGEDEEGSERKKQKTRREN